MPEHKTDDPTCGCYGCIAEWEVKSIARDSLALLAQERVRVDLVAPDEIGRRTPPVELPLLLQLKMAAESKGSERGASGARRSGLPVDLVAMELLAGIGRGLHVDAVDLGARDELSSEDLFEDALALLAVVGSVDPGILASRAVVWRGWVVQIQAYLSPERRTPVPGVCPAEGCGQAEWFSYDEDGDMVSAPALMALWEGDRVDAVMCSCCFAVWPRGQLWELGQALGQGLDWRTLARPE